MHIEQREELTERFLSANRALLDAMKLHRQEMAAIEQLAIEESLPDYQSGDKVMVELREEQERAIVPAYVRSIWIDTEVSEKELTLYVSFSKARKDGSKSDHQLQNVEKIISKA